MTRAALTAARARQCRHFTSVPTKHHHEVLRHRPRHPRGLRDHREWFGPPWPPGARGGHSGLHGRRRLGNWCLLGLRTVSTPAAFQAPTAGYIEPAVRVYHARPGGAPTAILPSALTTQFRVAAEHSSLRKPPFPAFLRPTILTRCAPTPPTFITSRCHTTRNRYIYGVDGLEAFDMETADPTAQCDFSKALVSCAKSVS